VAVVRSLRHRDGRLFILGLCGSRRDPRTFRVDRIIRVATPDGEVLDTREFLTDWLGIPPRLCAEKA
jgi:predicted DNA-binding transcriptional regulator YafY